MWNDAGVLGTQKGAGVEFPMAPCSGPAGSLLAGPFLQFFFKLIYFRPHHVGYRILVSGPGIELMPLAMKVCILNH